MFNERPTPPLEYLAAFAVVFLVGLLVQSKLD